ncbi:MAG: Crp/Fnr family transcriptional regulator [Pseudolabrys sp.]|nr:Crp/Fnr family transcriptional regulator [Pseudolabrys sp.]MDP2294608.1 Crp/Fnr family transcriptional regulator [Pseudolabrys sp.]
MEIPALGTSNRLLDSLPAAEIALLKPHLKAFVMEQGALLQEPGDQISHIYYPLSGMISLLAVMKQGNSVEVATVGREGAVGAMSGFGSRHAFTRAIVQVDGVASRIAATPFQEAMKKSAVLRETVARFHEGLLAQVQQTAACNALHDLEQRLCRWLLQTQDRAGGDLITLTHEFLSQMLAVRRTTVTLVARNLQEAGAIEYRRGKIRVVDRRKLEKRACECYKVVSQQIDKHLPGAKA